MNKFDYDMIQLEKEDPDELKKKRKELFRKTKNIDPETGRPYPTPKDDQDISNSEDLEDDVYQVSHDNKELNSEKF